MFCFCFFWTFAPIFFTSKSIVFVDGGRKNISCPRAKGTLATPLGASEGDDPGLMQIFGTPNVPAVGLI